MENLQINKRNDDLNRLKSLYRNFKEVDFYEFSDFEKKTLYIKSKLFSNKQIEEKNFEKIMQILDKKVEEFRLELNKIRKLEEFRKQKKMYYSYDDLIDEKQYFYDCFCIRLEIFRKKLITDFERFGCIFIDEKTLEKKLFELERYYDIFSRISKIKFIASMEKDFETFDYEYEDFLNENQK